LHVLNVREEIIPQTKISGIHLRNWSSKNTADSVILTLFIKKQSNR